MVRDARGGWLAACALVLLCALLGALTACNTLEVRIEPPATPTRASEATATPPARPAPTITVDASDDASGDASGDESGDVSGWGTITDHTFGVSFRYPAGWQPADAGEPGARFAGEDGFFEIGAMGGDSLDDVVAAEAGHHLRPYGSQPIIESLRVAGQEARLILPASDQPSGMAAQAALIVRYPRPVTLSGQSVPFFVLWADAAHIRTIAQTLQFRGDASGAGGATPPSPVIWRMLPPGLVFSGAGGLNLVDADEQPVLLHNDPQAVLSPDGSRLLIYNATQQDVWLFDRGEGALWKLTDTPERAECCLRWWPARPDVVLFQSLPAPADGPLAGIQGYLATVDLDRQQYHVLDPEHAFGQTQFAASPDGQSLAYSDGETAWLHRWDGVERFDPAERGLLVRGGVQLNQPAWSPDGGRLAWIVKGPLAVDGGLRAGVAVFDLEAGSAEVLHAYQPAGDGWPSAPVWSPTGAWLAFSDSSPSEQAGLWIARVAGEAEERHLGLGGNPIWSPDGRWLVFLSIDEQGVPTYAALSVETWDRRTLNLPVDRYGELRDWIRLTGDEAP
jgi:TolB protein